MPITVPQRVAVLLDEDTRARISAYMDETSAENVSQALRTLLALGLARAGDFDLAFKRAALHEGVMKGLALFKSELGSAVDAAMQQIHGAEKGQQLQGRRRR